MKFDFDLKLEELEVEIIDDINPDQSLSVPWRTSTGVTRTHCC